MTPTRAVPKYAPPEPIEIPDRQWPSRTVTTAPTWCSVDLRDGNQALPDPMSPAQKLEYFALLCRIGFKHIEVSFPSASQDDFDFVRRLIEGGHVPDDVYIMVLSVCRADRIERTMESLRGIPRGIVHLYLATSPLHTEQVLHKGREEWLEMATASVRQVRRFAEDEMPESDVRFEFSPEEFTDSDLEFVLEGCTAVYDAWGRATAEEPMILNLPATVERRPPNHYADMIEWFCRRFPARERVSISVHSHNDQGMAVAASELALTAGADRVEGTLFGHGERTGNVDIVTLANNLASRGVETGLDFSNLPAIVAAVERLTGIPVYPRQPYAGEYVFSAFSGTHQDAIRKGMRQLDQAAERFGVGWKVPYLHVDPADLGRTYKRLIRINTQSGKGGAAWALEQDYGLHLPRAMHGELGAAVQRYADRQGREISSEEVYRVFEREFLRPDGPYELVGYWPRPDEDDPTRIHGEVKVRVGGEEKSVTADGNGPVSAFVHGLGKLGLPRFSIEDYDEQAVGKGEDARAVAYVPLQFEDGSVLYGAGMDTNIDQAAVRAIVSGLNRRARAGG